MRCQLSVPDTVPEAMVGPGIEKEKEGLPALLVSCYE